MQRFFLPLSARNQQTVIFTDAERVNQISKVLRGEVGDKILCLFNDGEEHVVELKSFSKKEIIGEIIESRKNQNECSGSVVLFQALPKSKEKWEFIVQKAVELGATEIIPLKSSRSSAKYPANAPRLQKIIEEASEQSERGKLLQVHEAVFIKDVSLFPVKNLFVADSYDASAPLLSSLNIQAGSAGICIGPEGGFSEEEIQVLKEIGATSVSLGKRILRLETASILALGILTLGK